MPRFRGTLKIGEVFAECVKNILTFLVGSQAFLSCRLTTRQALDIFEGSNVWNAGEGIKNKNGIIF